MHKTAIATLSDLKPLIPAYALVADVDLVVIRWKEGDQISVLYGRRGANSARIAPRSGPLLSNG